MFRKYILHFYNAAVLVNTLNHDATRFESLIQFYYWLLCLRCLRWNSFYQCMLQSVDKPAAACIWLLNMGVVDIPCCDVFNALHLQQSKSYARHVVKRTWCSDTNYGLSFKQTSSRDSLSFISIKYFIIAIRSTLWQQNLPSGPR